MPPADANPNPAPAPIPPPEKKGFLSKITGAFKKKPEAAVVLPPNHTSQTPEPRLDNIPADAGMAATTPQSAPVGDMIYTQAAAPMADPLVDSAAPPAPTPQPVGGAPQPAAPASAAPSPSSFGAGGFTGGESAVATPSVDPLTNMPQAGIVSTPATPQVGGEVPQQPPVVQPAQPQPMASPVQQPPTPIQPQQPPQPPYPGNQ